MLVLKASVVIPRPVADVWEYATKPENASVWIPGLDNARQVTDGPLAAGTQWRAEAHLLGIKLTSLLEFTRCEPHKAVDFTLKGKVAVTAMTTLEEVDGGTHTRSSYRVEITTGRAFVLLPAKVVDMTIGRIVQASLENLADAVSPEDLHALRLTRPARC